MPALTGNIAVNKLTLQAHGSVSTSNLVMEVKDSAFTMSMGNQILMTVAPDGVDEINEAATDNNSLLTISRNTRIDGTLEVTGDVTVPNVEVSSTLAASNVVVNGTNVKTEFSNISKKFTDVSTSNSWLTTVGGANFINSIQDNLWLNSSANTDFTKAIYNMVSVNKQIFGTTTDGAQYQFVIPPNFNGSVALYSHGYRYNTGFANIGILQYPNVVYLPQDGPSTSNYSFVPTKHEEFLHAQGVATIGSGFTVQGWNRNQAVATNYELLNKFKALYPQTETVMIWGDSLGGHITQAFAETYPELIDSVGLMDVAYNVVGEIGMAFDVIWAMNQLFNSNIQFQGFSTDLPTRTAQIEYSVGLTLGVITSVQSNPLGWPSTKTNIGVSLSNAGVTSGAALHVLGAMAGVPNKSAHFGGAIDTSNVNTNFYPYGTLENLFSSAILGVNAISDLESKVGGSVVKNTDITYTNRISSMNLDQFNYVIPFGSTPTALVGGVLGALDAYGTKVSGVSNVLLTDGTLGVNRARITKPTVVMISEADQITPIGGVRQLVTDYNSNVAIGLATSNMLQVLISPAPSTPYANSLSTPAVLGTNHANFTTNNYVLTAAMMLYGATTHSVATGTTLANGIAYTENIINGSNAIFTYPRLKYDIENN